MNNIFTTTVFVWMEWHRIINPTQSSVCYCHSKKISYSKRLVIILILD